MPPTPALLRAAADQLRATARRLDLDITPLAAKGDHQTWEGPAATTFRRTATDVQGRVGTVDGGLRRIAERLEARAVALEAAEAARAAAAEEVRRRAEERPPPPSPISTAYVDPSVPVGGGPGRPVGADLLDAMGGPRG